MNGTRPIDARCIQSQLTTDGNGTKDAQHKESFCASQPRQVNVNLTRKWSRNTKLDKNLSSISKGI